MLEILLRLGVRCVTVFAFAIPNFKRPAREVDDLMQLAEEKLLELCQHGCVGFPTSALLDSISAHFERQLLDTHGVRLNVLGKRELLPLSVQVAVRKAEDLTRHNDRCRHLFILRQHRGV